MKKYIHLLGAAGAVFFLFLFILHSDDASFGVQRGLLLCSYSVLPALFPAMVFSGMVGQLAESLPAPPALTVWLTAQLCGFPLGMRTLTLAYRRGLLRKKQALKLSACCSNASPAFLITYIGEALFKQKSYGIALLLGQILISFFLFLCSGALKEKKIQVKTKAYSLLNVFTQSVGAAASAALTLCAYITIFCVLAALLKEAKGFSYFYGFLELVGGIDTLPKSAPFLGAAMVGFSGLCVFFQNAAYLLEENLSLWPMFFGKIIYGLWMPLFLLIFEKI